MRLIDADALKEEVNKKEVVGRFNTIMLIDNAPTVEPSLNLNNITEEDIEKFKTIFQRAHSKGLLTIIEERPQGEWIYHKAEGYFLPTMECSECHANDLLGDLTRKEYKAVNNFCFNCGADMRKGGAE